MRYSTILAGILFVTGTAGTAQPSDSPTRTLASARGVELRDSPVQVPLQPNGNGANALSNLRATDQLRLVIRDLQYDRSLDTTYDVFLNMPANTPASGMDRYLAGNLSLYARQRADAFASFDVTEIARTTRKINRPLLVTIVPVRTPKGHSAPVGRLLLGRIELLLLQRP